MIEWYTRDGGTVGFRVIAEQRSPAMTTNKPAVQGEPLRYTNDGALAECPCCGSIVVGGAHDTVSCYSCDLTVTKPRPLQNAIDAWNTRTGRTHPAPAVQGEPEQSARTQSEQGGEWPAMPDKFYEGLGWMHAECCAALDRGEDPRASEVGDMVNRCIHDLTCPQPAEQQPDATQLVEALEEGLRAIGDHHAPGDCYATGPMTGDPFRDLVQCPACSFIAMCDDLLAAYREGGKA